MSDGPGEIADLSIDATTGLPVGHHIVQTAAGARLEKIPFSLSIDFEVNEAGDVTGKWKAPDGREHSSTVNRAMQLQWAHDEIGAVARISTLPSNSLKLP